MLTFLLACTAALAVSGTILVSTGSYNKNKLLGQRKIDMTAEFSQFHRFMVITACIILCGIPLALVNVLTDGNPVVDVIAMGGLYLLLLYFVLNIFNRKIFVTSSGIAARTALGRMVWLSNHELANARMSKRVVLIRATCFSTPQHRVLIDEQMLNYHMVVAELQRRTLTK